MQKLTVIKDQWYRGHGDTHSALLTEDSRMCCLGFLAKQCGYSDEELYKESAPIVLAKEYGGQQRNIKGMLDLINDDRSDNSNICYELMDVNDDEELSESEREEKLTKLLKQINIEVEFK